MDTMVDSWTDREQMIARAALENARIRAVDILIARLRTSTEALASAEEVWQLHDFLSIERHTMEGRFDFRLGGILFVLAGLVKDELLAIEELEGLEADKLAKVKAMSRF
ncbi:hypothetical protein [Cyanobium sp. NIES-981]|uniref:hypothetical protein n=1 Tax=Cyanobium sp. NIES-981 TaxID=1851505 RepID=UPI0007DD1909|nr:hypothetical protein [Cyanobium sp. NIES-981]SBO44441.1 conserved protein of unknown function [Cyanobium sp. NIES-981]